MTSKSTEPLMAGWEDGPYPRMWSCELPGLDMLQLTDPEVVLLAEAHLVYSYDDTQDE